MSTEAQLHKILDESLSRLGDRNELRPRSASGNFAPNPLSAAQERLWYFSQIDRDPVSFIRPIAIKLDGELDKGILRDALTTFVDRHEVLRTSIMFENGSTVQYLLPHAAVDIEEVDVSGWDGRPFGADDLLLAAQDQSMTVGLAEPPYLKARLYHLEVDANVLFLAFHHTVMDAWSAEIAAYELSALYDDLASGSASRLPRQVLQYADFAVYQHDQLDSGKYDHSLKRIISRLGDVTQMVFIPTDRQRQTVRSHRGAEVRMPIPDELVTKLVDLSAQEGCTLFMILVAVYGILLSRWTGSTSITLGCPEAGRRTQGTESVLGFFVNRFLLHLDLSGNPTFREYLKAARADTLDALSDSETPFELVLDRLAPAGGEARTPLFQSAFNFENIPNRDLVAGSVSFERLRVPVHTAPSDVSVEIQNADSSLEVSFIYGTDVFDRETIAWMGRQYKTLLAAVVRDPESPIESLPLLADDERIDILKNWSSGGALESPDTTIHAAFEGQVTLRPDATAVICGDDHATYRQLNESANRLARYLQSAGVRRGSRVAVKLGRSVDLVAACLAVLKTGAAYVPIDTLHPDRRQAMIITRSEAQVILTTSDLLPAGLQESCKALLLDRDLDVIDTMSGGNLDVQVPEEAVAYIVHTSGSTGIPKGIPTSHQSVVRFLNGISTAQMGPECRHLWISSITFDMTNYQLYGAILYGACCVISREEQPTPSGIARTIERHQPTSARMTPSFFNLLIDEVPESLKSMRHISNGGEAMSVHYSRMAMQLLPDSTLTNWYGPTETISSATEYKLSEPPGARTISIPIGRPQPGRTVYILDDYLEPVPPGVPGELYIGGEIMAEGYLNDPVQTAERFVPDPYSGTEGAVMYRTGDLSRWLPDRNIEFLGRIDRQVQLRGFRVEPGEIESAVVQVQGVKEGAVIPVELGSGGMALMAFLVVEPDIELVEEEIRAILLEILPHHLVPAVIVLLDNLPKTVAGKMDYKALEAMAPSMIPTQRSSRKPRTDTETRLAVIWSDVLEVDDIGVEDDFFLLGGHSLLAAKLYVRIEREFGTEIPIAALFGAPTIESLAELIDDQGDRPARRGITDWSPLVRIKEKGAWPPFFLVTQGNVIGLEKLAEAMADDRAFFALHTPAQHLNHEEPDTIEQMAERYLSELRKVQRTGPYLLGGQCAGSIVAYEMASRLRAEGEVVALLAAIDSIRPPAAVGSDGNVVHPRLDEFVIAHSRKLSTRARIKRQLARPYKKAKRQFFISAYRKNRLQVRDAIFAARLHYRPNLYDGPITVFQAIKPTAVQDLQDLWSCVTSDEVEFRTLDATHSEIWREPWVSETAAQLSRRIAEVLETTRQP